MALLTGFKVLQIGGGAAAAADIALVGIGTFGSGSSSEVLEGLGLTGSQRGAFLSQLTGGELADVVAEGPHAVTVPIRATTPNRPTIRRCLRPSMRSPPPGCGGECSD